MIKLSFTLAFFTALLSWLCYPGASEEYAYFHQGGRGEESFCYASEGMHFCVV